MKLFKKKDTEEETVTEENVTDILFEEDNKKQRKRRKIFLLVAGILFIVIGILMIWSSLLFSKKDTTKRDSNLDYLTKTYGEDVSIGFLKKNKDIFSYNICSKKTSFCAVAQYNEAKKEWIYPNGESQVNVVLFMDKAVSVLENNNVNYATYTDATTSHDIQNNYVLVIEKDDVSALTRSIININESGLIVNICSSEECNANYHVSIFNKADYDIITSKVKQTDSIKNYADLYEILFKSDDDVYGTRLGENIERHNIGDGMFNCNDEDCNNHKHIAYRYVAGSHNYVDSTIIVEGIN